MKIRLGTNFAIFVLFFGMALLDALHDGAWLKAAFWVAIGSVFLIAEGHDKK